MGRDRVTGRVHRGSGTGRTGSDGGMGSTDTSLLPQQHQAAAWVLGSSRLLCQLCPVHITAPSNYRHLNALRALINSPRSLGMSRPVTAPCPLCAPHALSIPPVPVARAALPLSLQQGQPLLMVPGFEGRDMWQEG